MKMLLMDRESPAIVRLVKPYSPQSGQVLGWIEFELFTTTTFQSTIQYNVNNAADGREADGIKSTHWKIGPMSISAVTETTWDYVYDGQKLISTSAVDEVKYYSCRLVIHAEGMEPIGLNRAE